MPTRFVQRRSKPFLAVRADGVTAIGVDSDDDSLKWAGGTSATPTIQVAPQVLVLTYPLIATSVDADWTIFDNNYTVTGVKAVVTASGVAGSTVQLRKCTSTIAVASGAPIMSSALTLAGTTAFVFSGTLTSTTADLSFVAGDRLGVDLTGTLTNLVGTVTVYVKRIE